MAGCKRHRAPVLLQHGVTQGEAEPHALLGPQGFGGKIRIENPGQVLRGDAAALVGDPDADIVARRQSGRRIGPEGLAQGPHLHDGAGWGRFAGVTQHLLERLQDRGTVEGQRGQGGGQVIGLLKLVHLDG